MKLNIHPYCYTAVLGLSLAGSVSAAGFQLLEQNASGLGNAYAGSAVVTDNASLIFYNPAGMALLKDREISVGFNVIKPSFKFTDSGSSTGSGGDAGGWNVVPNIYAKFGGNEKWDFGLGVSAPFGLKTDYQNPWIGGAQSLLFEIKTLNVNPSLAYRIDPNLSLGLGFNIQNASAKYQRIFSTTSPDSLASLDMSGHAFGWNTGVLYQSNDGIRVGFSYRSQVQYDMTGTLTVTGLNPTLDAAYTGNVKAHLHLPDTLLLSASQSFGTYEVLADVSRIGWSSMPKVDILYTSIPVKQTLETKFRDTWRVALGGNYRVNSHWKMKSGIAWDQTPVTSAETRMVSLPDNDRIWLSLGTQWTINKDINLDLGAAYLFVKDPTINNDQSKDVPSHGKVQGSYEGGGMILGMQYSQAF